jgi:3-deoxy-7-phosphoheptulonate synthase
LSAIPTIRRLSHLPVIVDPSHACGKRHLVPPLSRAAVAVGADGLIIEVHPDPENALSDGPQSLTFSGFEDLITGIEPIVEAMGRQL